MDKDFTDKEKLDQVFGIHDSSEIEDFKAWTEAEGKKIARKMGLKMTTQHWEVINFLRVHFQNVGAKMPPVHEFSQVLEERFSDQGGLKYLFSLFPGGPLSQGFQIAGIPVPDDAKDPHFGSLH